jgi:hypothetical protein
MRDTYLLQKTVAPIKAHVSRVINSALNRYKGDFPMAAMKPRTGDGPMEVTKEARSLVMRIPLEGGGRLVVEMNPQEANNLSAALGAAVALIKK